MKRKNYAISIILMLALSPIIVNRAAAQDNDLNLPQDPVIMTVVNGTESYFLTTLSGIPPGYDVANGTYLGWCVDTRAEMARNQPISVRLYSSLNPPGELANEEWDMVNYILNNKPQNAEIMDIQEAIWYFIHMNTNYTPSRPLAWQIVNDALENGNNFFPEIGRPVAVICYPLYMPPDYEVQVSIIEVENTVIPEFPSINILLVAMPVMLLITAIYKKFEAKVRN